MDSCAKLRNSGPDPFDILWNIIQCSLQSRRVTRLKNFLPNEVHRAKENNKKSNYTPAKDEETDAMITKIVTFRVDFIFC